jgi:P-loop containing dynein motor region
MDLVPPQTISEDVKYEDITVMTLDVVRYTYLMNTLVQSHKPVLLCGPTGTGKSVYTKDYLANKLDKAAWMYMTFGFSAQTSVNMTQVCALLMQRCVHGMRSRSALSESEHTCCTETAPKLHSECTQAKPWPACWSTCAADTFRCGTAAAQYVFPALGTCTAPAHAVQALTD